MKNKLPLLFIACLMSLVSFSHAPTITSFSPASGPVGTLVTITGTNLSSPTAFTIGGVSAIVVSDIGDTLVGMVMPGAVSGTVSVTTAGGTAASGSNYAVTATPYPHAQQGAKLVGTGAVGGAFQGYSVAISADGNTAIVGGDDDNRYVGAAWVYARSGNMWSQQGTKLVGAGAAGKAWQGHSVAISADGNTVVVGGPNDSSSGAAWVYVRSGSTWSQQGAKLVGTGTVDTADQGWSVALSADGNTAIVGGIGDSHYVGAAWVYVRSGSTWSQQGAKLTGTGAVHGTGTFGSQQGWSIAISANGNTAIVGGYDDSIGVGAAWVYARSGGIWSQQGTKLVGTHAVGTAWQGYSVALSADGNTALVGGPYDSSSGAAWVYARLGSTWSQQGAKLVGTGAMGAAGQGTSVAVTADGNTAIVGGYGDSNYAGAVWVYVRSGSTWAQQGAKLVGTGAVDSPYAAEQGFSLAVSADGSTAIVGGWFDNNEVGAAWVYIPTCPVSISVNSLSICPNALPYSWNGLTFTSGGSQTAHLTNSAGCDSAATLNLSVNPVSYDTIPQSICSGDSLTFGGVVYRSQGFYSHVFTGSNGCDSTVTLHLNVTPLPSVTWAQTDTFWCEDVATPPSYYILTSDSPGGGVFSGAHVSGDTLYPTAMGSYPVTYTYSDIHGCSSSVSKEFMFEICSGISQADAVSVIGLYPNPNTGTFTLETSGRVGEDYAIYDMVGRQIERRSIASDMQIINVPLSPGVYQILIRSAAGEMNTLRYEVVR